MVFMGHGLVVAFFTMTTAVAAAALWRTQTRVLRLPPAGVTVYLSAVLVLCKSLGALVYGAVLVPLVRLTKPRSATPHSVGACDHSFALSYASNRGPFPDKIIVDAATLISTDRASSMKFRFDNEDRLLQHASQRLLFGWGRWGRSRVYDAERTRYQRNGRALDHHDRAVRLVRFPGRVWAARSVRFPRGIGSQVHGVPRERVFLAALALIVAINIVELLPNSAISPWTWLLAGALLGRAEACTAFLGSSEPRICPSLIIRGEN